MTTLTQHVQSWWHLHGDVPQGQTQMEISRRENLTSPPFPGTFLSSGASVPRGRAPGSAHLRQVSVGKVAQVLLQGADLNRVLVPGGEGVGGQHGEERPASVASRAASGGAALSQGQATGRWLLCL